MKLKPSSVFLSSCLHLSPCLLHAISVNVSVSEACHENVNWIWQFDFHFTNYLTLLNNTKWNRELTSEENTNNISCHRQSLSLQYTGYIAESAHLVSVEGDPTHFSFSKFCVCVSTQVGVLWHTREQRQWKFILIWRILAGSPPTPSPVGDNN